MPELPGELGGAAMVIDLLVKRADELGVQIRYETGATALITAALASSDAATVSSWLRGIRPSSRASSRFRGVASSVRSASECSAI